MRLVEPAQRLVEVHCDGGRRVGRVRRGLLVRARSLGGRWAAQGPAVALRARFAALPLPPPPPPPLLPLPVSLLYRREIQRVLQRLKKTHP